jgi:hypothetical protein
LLSELPGLERERALVLLPALLPEPDPELLRGTARSPPPLPALDDDPPLERGLARCPSSVDPGLAPFDAE